MPSPISLNMTLGRISASLPGTATTPRQETALLPETTNKERAIRRFEAELAKFTDQGNPNKAEAATISSMNPVQVASGTFAQLGENEKYAKALLIAVREEIYKKGYKSTNKLRPPPPGKNQNQWEKKEVERHSEASSEITRIRATLGQYPHSDMLMIQKAIEARAHNCGDLSFAGIGILDEAGIKDKCIVSFKDFDHGMILIGKLPVTGLPLKMEDWPSGLAICDPWSNIACSAKEFVPEFIEKMQKWQAEGKKIYDGKKRGWSDPGRPDLLKKLRTGCAISSFSSKLETEIKDANGRTALMSASQMGYINDVLMLLKAGVNIEAKDKNGFTALMLAAAQSKTEVVEALLEAGANIDAEDEQGRTALTFASEELHIDTIKALLKAKNCIAAKNNDDWTALTLSLPGQEQIEATEPLFKAGANIEAEGNYDWTSLALPLPGQEQIEAAQTLLQLRTNIEASDEGEKPPKRPKII